MTYAQSALLGALQGLTEFLPVSSSAHLALAPWALGFHDPGLTFDVALHVGTLMAILAAFGRRWSEIVLGAIREPRGEQARIFLLLAMASVPAAVAGLSLEKLAEESFRSPLLIAAVLFVFGLVLGAAESWGSRRREWAQVGWKVFLAVGAAQALAIIPGVSRSGVTISAGLFLGLTPVSAAELSFLLSAPIIAGAAAHKLGHIAVSDVTGPFVFGVVVSALTGWSAVRFFLRGLARWGLRPYVFYRSALAAAVLALYFAR